MKVTLIDYTGAGSPDPARHAASILLFTKETRLEMKPELFEEITLKSDEEILENLRIMSRTNPGSWEFVHFTFLFQNVTRAFTHQLVRTRTASYAQQTMRMVKMKDFTYETGPSITDDIDNKVIYDSAMRYINHAYETLIENGVRTEDARGILPTNIHTNICMTINMRNLINMVRKRQSKRVQDEHVKVANMMVVEIEKVYPWFYLFYNMREERAYNELSNMISDSPKLSNEEKIEMYKYLDIIRGEL